MEQKIFIVVKTPAYVLSAVVPLLILFCFVFFYQRPLVDQQAKALEMQKQIFEAQKRQWKRDSIRKAHEIKMLDSALYRIKNFK